MNYEFLVIVHLGLQKKEQLLVKSSTDISDWIIWIFVEFRKQNHLSNLQWAPVYTVAI